MQLRNGDHAILVAGPAAFDFSFVAYYLHRFVGKCIFGHAPRPSRAIGGKHV